MHMIERVTDMTCYCEKEHHPLRIKNDLKAPVVDRRAAAGGVGSKETSPRLLFKKNSACSLGYASPNTPPR
jgi:hypothetical protein